MSHQLARLRPLWIGLTVIAIVAVALTFSPVQAMASSFLQLFRVQQVTVLPLDLTSLKDTRFNPAMAQTISQVMADKVKITRQPGTAHTEPDAAAASKDAGFPVRLGQNTSLPLARLEFQPGVAFEGTFDQALAEQVLQGLGKGDLKLPAGLDGAVIKANIPDAVTAAYGTCRFNDSAQGQSVTGVATTGVNENCMLLVQVPSPTVDTPPDLPVAQLADIGLQVLGMTPDQASKLAYSIDWTNTLVIPVPSGQVNSQTVFVDGVSGTLLTQVPGATLGTQKSGSAANLPPEVIAQMTNTYSLVWVKNGIVYGILGSGDTANAINLANSLK